ncbi:thioredoxin-dependent thiol peroxidase [Spelaeicoccus albus]|uniref:thioredoxin-dependent peroxiredoxin n=1 Tax=Spelaeicoccus albus TaxID=1280376 RepID=A0A7Z0AAC3_9MICO|nr:thioredoxin-dependent thiol peroxidase [Spelaeicoccus albus]NYI67354.1 peroxiredoxin Q/BCP [Spelaeicoccus albus]
MTQQLAVGDKAPAFSLENADGETVSPADYAGRNVVVYFYPKAGTPGCTTEACDFRDNLASLSAIGYDVVGISPDDRASIAEFARNEHLTFPLLADPDASVAKAYGAYGEMTFGDKTFNGVLRSTFVIGSDGRVARAEYRVDANGHVARLREQLAA